MRVKLCRGKGHEGQSHCVMAATAMLNGESFTDRPICVDGVITEMLIVINDSAYMSGPAEFQQEVTYKYHAGKGMLPENETFLVNRSDDCPDERNQELGYLPWIIIGTRGNARVVNERYSAAMNYMFPTVKPDKSAWDIVSESELAGILSRHLDGLHETAKFVVDRARQTLLSYTNLRYSLNFATNVYLLDIRGRLSPADYKQKRRELIAFIENVLVPIYTEAPKEESYADRIKNLHLQENDNATCIVS